MRATRALSSLVVHEEGEGGGLDVVVVGWEGCGSGVWGRGKGVSVEFVRAEKSEGSRPRGRLGGCVRWRLGVEGPESSVGS